MERKLFLFGNPWLKQDSISLEIGRREAMALLAYLALQTQGQGLDALSLSEAFNHPSSLALSFEHLAEIFEWFDEGFETPDLREAKDLLASQG